VTASNNSTASSATGQRHGSRALLAVGVAMGISSAGSVLNVLALLTYLYQRTQSPLPLGLAVLVNFLPVVVILPLIAPKLGRWPLWAVTGGAAFIQAIIAGSMTILAATHGPLVVLYVASSALGLLTQILWISTLTALPKLVRAADLSGKNVVLQIASQSGAVLGALGLVIQGSAPAWILFLIDALTYVVQAAILIFLLRPAAGVRTEENAPDDVPAPHGAPKPSVHWRERGLALLMPAGFVAVNVLNIAIPLIVFSRLHDGQRGYAAAEMAYPVVAVLVGMAIRRYGKPPLVAALAVVAAGFVGLVLSVDIAVLIVSVGAMGGGIIAANVSTQVLAQSEVGPDALPRVQARASVLAAAISAAAIAGLTVAFEQRSGNTAMLGLALWYVVLLPVAVTVRRAFASVDSARVEHVEGEAPA
jgi:hypothetical protein